MADDLDDLDDVLVRIQVTCTSVKPDCLIIDPELLTHFQVTALRVLGIDVLPKEPTSSEMTFSAKTTQIGDWITVEVVNFSPEPKLFHAAIGGNIVR